MTVGLGIVTYRRPESLARVLQGVATHLTNVIDALHIYEDGSGLDYAERYGSIGTSEDALAIPGTFKMGPENRGVAYAKNQLLRTMLDEGHDWIFIGEDDILPTNPKAITGYIEACEISGLQHLNFHAHGPLNPEYKALTLPEYDGVTMWPHFVGAWSIYSRKSLEDCGLMDEAFENCWEHVEHTMRLGLKGYTTLGFRFVADATGSENWLTALEDQPSSIGTFFSDEVRRERQARGQQHWAQAHPDSYSLIFWAG